jgi:hypothetical protein
MTQRHSEIKKMCAALLFITLVSCPRPHDTVRAEEAKQFDGIFDRKTARTFATNKISPEQTELLLKAA